MTAILYYEFAVQKRKEGSSLGQSAFCAWARRSSEKRWSMQQSEERKRKLSRFFERPTTTVRVTLSTGLQADSRV